MKIALIQFNATADKDDNIRRASKMVIEAASLGSRFILLPEVFSWRGNTHDARLLAQVAENLSGPIVKQFSCQAKEHKVFVLLGSMVERVAGKAKAYNTSVLISPDGKIAARYRKIHLFDARLGKTIIQEADRFLPGRVGQKAKVDGFTIGLSVCYDLRFPAMYQAYNKQGVNLLTAPSCFTQKTGQAHWEVLVRARAIDNLSFVLAPNQVGADAQGTIAYGNSMIVSPWGEVLAQGSSNKEEIVYGSIDTSSVNEARRTLPGVIK